MSSTKKYRFFVIGCGSIGRRHIRNLKALNAGEIIVYDEIADRRQSMAHEYGINSVDSLKAGWERSPNVTFITVPTGIHVPLALEAAKRGCHLFIEKPLSDRVDSQLDELLEVVRTKRLVSLVGCNMRFHPDLMKVKELIEKGTVGCVTSARVEYGQYLPDWRPWEDYQNGYSAQKDLGGGVILDAIHEIDYVRWMLGEVEAVACFSGKLSDLQINTEDTAAILLRFKEGAIGEVHLDYVQREYSRTSHIVGNKGTIRWNCKDGDVQLYLAETKKWQSYRNISDWDSNSVYVDEIRHFMRCLDGEDRPCLDVFDAKRVLQIALAAKESAEKQVFIKLENA